MPAKTTDGESWASFHLIETLAARALRFDGFSRFTQKCA